MATKNFFYSFFTQVVSLIKSSEIGISFMHSFTQIVDPLSRTLLVKLCGISLPKEDCELLRMTEILLLLLEARFTTHATQVI